MTLFPQEFLRQNSIPFVKNAPNGEYTTPCKCGGKLQVKYDSTDASFRCDGCGWSGASPAHPSEGKGNGKTAPRPPDDDDYAHRLEEAKRDFLEDEPEFEPEPEPRDPEPPKETPPLPDLAVIVERELKNNPYGPFGDEIVEKFKQLLREQPAAFACLCQRYSVLAAAAALDAAAVRAAIESADKKEVVALFFNFVLVTDLDPIEADTLLRLVAQKSGIKLRPLHAKLKNTQQARAELCARAARAKRLAERKERGDPRPMIDEPADNAPWLPIANAVNDVLGQVTAFAPPERDIDGTATRGRKLAIPKMHAFSQLQANPLKPIQKRRSSYD